MPRHRLYGKAEGEELPIRDRPYESFGQQGVAMPTYAPRPYDPERDPVRGGAEGVARVSLGEPVTRPEPRPRGPRGYQRSDASIGDEIAARLTDAGDIDATDIEIDVRDGEVTLEGKVAERRQRLAAEDLAGDVRGVVDVINRIRVARGNGDAR